MWQVPSGCCHTQYQEEAEMPLPVQAHCSGTANLYRQPPESLLLLLPAPLQEGDPGRVLNPALVSCCIWQCTPAEGKSLVIKTE